MIITEENILKLISSYRLDLALEKLNKLVENDIIINRSIIKELILLTARHNSYLSKKNNGVLNFEEDNIFSNKITINLYDLTVKVFESKKEYEIEKTEESIINESEKLREKLIQILDSNENDKRGQLFKFIEKNPGVLPGMNGHKGNLTHGAHYGLIFPEMNLSNEIKIVPDFLYVSTNSLEGNIIFVKISNPDLQIFDNRNDFSTEFNLELSDIQSWKNWFEIEENKNELINQLTLVYDSKRIKRLNIKAEYYLVIGRRKQYYNDENKQKKLSNLSHYPTSLLSYDRLEPYPTGNWYLPVRRDENGELYASYISKFYDYNQAKSVIHGKINKKNAVLENEDMTDEKKKKLIREIDYWDSFDDPMKAIMAQIENRKKN